MRPLLVGLMPNKSNGGPPLSGAIGKKLMAWAGLGCPDGNDGCPGGIRSWFDTINLNSRHGAKFDEREAQRIVSRIPLDRPIILCGREVAKQFYANDQAYWRWVGPLVVIPHPSGRCRIYNDKKACAATGRTLKQALKIASEFTRAKK